MPATELVTETLDHDAGRKVTVCGAVFLRLARRRLPTARRDARPVSTRLPRRRNARALPISGHGPAGSIYARALTSIGDVS
jgi:hypothetical protein